MKKHEKNCVENGNGKGAKTFLNRSQNGMRKLARNALHPAQHSLQHINKKLLRSQIRERCLRQTIKRESAEEECDERVPLRESACKGRSKHPESTTPLRAQAARGRISVACGNGSAPGPLQVGFHVMVCYVFVLIRKGFGDLRRKWQDTRAPICDELEDERLNVLQIMAVKLVAA